MTQHPGPGPSGGTTRRVVSLVVAVLAGAAFLALLVASSTGLWGAPLPEQAFITGGAFLVAGAATVLYLR